jgi:hypothetical protein
LASIMRRCPLLPEGRTGPGLAARGRIRTPPPTSFIRRNVNSTAAIPSPPRT